MRIDKYTAANVYGLMRHYHRTIEHDKNTDIDPTRSPDNYYLTPYLAIPRDQQWERRYEIQKIEYQRYKDELQQLYVYNRKDVNTLCSAVITLPAELVNAPEAEKERFFRCSVDFMQKQYGHIISAVVHRDEGKQISIPDGSGGELIRFAYGRDHMHLAFIPAVKIDHKAITKKTHVKELEIYTEKVCANEVMTKRRLKELHPAFQRYMDSQGFHCNLNSGITAAQGGNRTVDQLKETTIEKAAALQQVVDQALINRSDCIKNLQNQVTDLNRQVDTLSAQLQAKTVNQTQSWGPEWSPERTITWTL